MQTLLCQDAETNPMIHEASYLREIMGVYRRARSTFAQNAIDYFGNPTELDVFQEELLRGVLSRVRSLHGNPAHLVLKEPDLTRSFPELSALLPDSRFVCMVRDPRDTIASMIRVGEKLGASAAGRNPFRGRSAEELSRLYLSFYLPLLRREDSAFRDRLLFVRYEDLVQQTDKVLDELRVFTGLSLGNIDPRRDFDTGTLDYRQASEHWKAWITEHYGRRISAARVASFRTDLSRMQTKTIERACGDMMALFGYGLSGSGGSAV
jgi:hypothetical protein